MPTTRSYQSYLIESLKDPQEAAAYLDAVLEDGSVEEVRLALRNITEAQMLVPGNVQLVAHRKAIYDRLTQQPQLDISTLLMMLHELGFKMSIEARPEAA
jgi:DNA-binding phage protein